MIRIRQQVRILVSEDMKLHYRSVLVIHRTELQDIPVNFSISRETFAGCRLSYLTAYQFSYILDILFHSDSHRLSAIATGLLRDRVRCVNLAQKISNRIDGSLRYKTLYNTFCIASIF